MTVQSKDKFLREPQDGWRVGGKVRCFNPGRYKLLEENAVYTVSWLDWPFCLEVEEIPNFTWDMRRFMVWTGEVTEAQRAKKPKKNKKHSGKGALFR